MLLGLLQQPFSYGLSGLFRRLSEKAGSILQNANVYRKLLGARTKEEQQNRFLKTYGAVYTKKGIIKGVNFLDAITALAETKQPPQLQPFISAVMLSARAQNELFDYGQAFQQIPVQTALTPDNERLTTGEFLTQQTIQQTASKAGIHAMKYIFADAPEQLVRYEYMKRYGLIGAIRQSAVAGEGLRKIFGGAFSYIARAISGKDTTQQLRNLQEGIALQSPATIARVFSQQTMKLVPEEQLRRYQVGMHAITQAGQALEQIQQPSVLNQLLQTPAGQNVLQRLNVEARSRHKISGRGFRSELNWLLTKYYLESGAQDTRLKALAEELQERLPKQQDISPVFRQQGLKPVTFLDIAEGKVQAHEILGRFAPHAVDERELQFFNERYRVIQQQLIRHGLPAETQIGYGVYRYQNRVVQLIPGFQAFLETADVLSRYTQVPYLGFNPLQSLQPSFLREYTFTRPSVQQYTSANQLVATRMGMRQIKDIQEDVLVQSMTRTPRLTPQGTVYNKGRLLSLTERFYNAKMEQFSREFLRYSTNKEALEYFKSQPLDQLKEAKQLVKKELSSAPEEARKHLVNVLGELYSARYKLLQSPETIKPSDMMNFLQKHLQVQADLQVKDFRSVSDEILDELRAIQTEQRGIIKEIREQQSRQRLYYFGTKPYLHVGNRSYDVSNIVYEMINLRKSQLSGRLIEVYSLQTGTIRMFDADKARISQMQYYNMPFDRSFSVGDTYLTEFKRIITTPLEYDKKLKEMADFLYENRQFSTLLGIQRAVRRLDLPPELITPQNEEEVYQLQQAFYQIQRAANYQKIQLKEGSLSETEARAFRYITNLFSLNSIEQSVYSELQDAIQQTGRMPQLDWFNEVVSKTGATRLEVITGLQSVTAQAQPVIRESLESAVRSVLESGQREAQEALQKKNVENALEWLSQLRQQLEPVFKLEENQLVQEVLQRNRHLRIHSKTADQLATQYLQTELHRFGLEEFRERQLQSTNFFAQSVQNALYELSPVNVRGKLQEVLNSYRRQQYEKILTESFGETFVENIQLSMAGKSVPLHMLERYRVRFVDTALLQKWDRESQLLETKYIIDIQQNKYVQLAELGRIAEESSPLEALRRILQPDVQRRKSDVGSVNAVSLMTHHILGRPTSYLDLLGIGRPNIYESTNQFKEIGGVLQKLQWISAGVQAIGLLDLQFTTATLGTVGGQQLVGELASDMYVGQMQILDALGIRKFGQEMHYRQPGFLQTQFGLYGLFSGGITGYFFGQQVGSLMEYIPSTREQVLQVEGVTNVPVYNARGWEFGSQPYWGWQVKQYRPHLLYLFRKEYQYTPLMFGSKLEYQMFEQPFPTPLNLFGILPLVSDYYDTKMLGFRPYPLTGQPSGTGTPQLINPPLPLSQGQFAAFAAQNFFVRQIMPSESLLDQYTRTWDTQISQLQQQSYQVSSQAYGYVSSAVQFARSAEGQVLFAANIPQATTMQVRYYSSLKYKSEMLTSEFFKSLEESRYALDTITEFVTTYTGFIGFMGEALLSPINVQDIQQLKRVKIQTSDYWRTRERLYYQMELGNIFGITEFPRRLVPNIRRQEMQVNPLPNIYLTLNFPWLPEHFRTGDAYQKISFGEFRLPGPGYEYIRGSVDEYGIIDIYRILQNVSPRSSQTKTLERFMERYQEKLEDPGLRYIIQQQIEEQQSVRRGMETREKVFNMKLVEETYRIKKYLGEGKLLTETGQIVEVRGQLFDVDQIAKRIFESENVTIEEAYRRQKEIQENLEQQLSSYEGSTVTFLVPEDEGLKVRWYGGKDFRIQQIAPIEIPEHAKRLETQVDIRQHYRPGVFERIWEVYSHSFGYHQEKFVPVRSAYEEFQRYYVFGMYRTDWGKPFSQIMLKSLLSNSAQNPFMQMSHGFMVGVLFGTNPQTQLAFGQIGQLTSAVQTALPPIEYPQWDRIRNIEQQTQQLKYLQGRKNIAELSALPQDIDELTGYFPFYERTVIEKLVNQQASDYEQILEIQPQPVAAVLGAVYRQKQQYAQGLVPETELLPEERQQILSYVQEGIQMLPSVVLENYSAIDVDQYRQFLFINNLQDITSVGVFDYQIYKQQESIIRDEEPPYFNTADFIRNMINSNVLFRQ